MNGVVPLACVEGGDSGEIGMRLLSRWSIVTICILGLLLGSLSATLGRVTPAGAATPSGAAYAWGLNDHGQLGNGPAGNSSTPAGNSSTPVAITLAPAVPAATVVAAGASHSLAIGSDGHVYAWGNNGSGQLGDGTTTSSSTPVMVNSPTGLKSTAIAAGAYHSLAIGSDGNVYAWGYNAEGQLGNGTMTNSSKPVGVSLPPGTTPLALGIGSEADHSLAILTTSAPTAAILSSFHAVHAGGAIRFHWRVASGASLCGFFLTAGTHRLNRRLIAVDAHRQSYAYQSGWQGHGPYLLHGVLQGGAVMTLATTG